MSAMSPMRVQSDTSRLVVDTTRQRQTAPPPSPFRTVLAGGAAALVSGATLATSVMGGPVLAAAVRGSPISTAATQLGAASSAAADLGTMHTLQKESQAFNLHLLSLQERIQQENRHFTTMSNVMRAKHDTAKATLANLRS